MVFSPSTNAAGTPWDDGRDVSSWKEPWPGGINLTRFSFTRNNLCEWAAPPRWPHFQQHKCSSLIDFADFIFLKRDCVCMLRRVQICDVVDCNPPSSSVHGISQARILEWVTISFSTGSSRPRDQIHISSISYILGRLFTAEALGKPTDALMHLTGALVVEMKSCSWPCSDAMADVKGGGRLRGGRGRRRCH